MNLYFVSNDSDANGNNADSFILAESPIQALSIWHTLDFAFDADLYQTSVFQVPTAIASDKPRALNWHSEVPETAFSKAELIAFRFVDELRRYLDSELRRDLYSEQWAEMRAKNATPEYGGIVCASHDYCDANVFMAEAFEAVTLKAPVSSFETDAQGNAIDPEEEKQANIDSALWSEAWGIAKAYFLTAKESAQ